MLNPAEQEAASAITEHYSAWISRLSIVKTFRQHVLDAGRLLSREEADTFIVSPVARFLATEDVQTTGVRWDNLDVRVINGG